MVICPVCGQEGYLEVRKTKSNTYYLVVHEVWQNGKRVKRIRHYIGPKDYKYVTRTHDFVLHGQYVKGRELEYLSTLADRLIESGDIKELEKLLPELLELKQDLDALIMHIQTAISVMKDKPKLTAGDTLSLENFSKYLQKKGNAETTIKKKLSIVKKFLASLDVPLPRINQSHITKFLLSVNKPSVPYARRTLKEFLDYIGLRELAEFLS